MPSKEQLFNEVFGAVSRTAAKEETAALQAEAWRWKKFLVARPGNRNAKLELKKIEKEIIRIKTSPENVFPFKNVQSLPFIKEVLVIDNEAFLETTDIMVDWRGLSVNMGSYLIVFKSNGKRPKIRRTLGRVRTSKGYYHHPHISNYSGVCWTDSTRIGNMLNEALRDKRPDIIATIAWTMLRNPLAGHPYVNGDRFLSAIVNPSSLEDILDLERLLRRFNAWITNSRLASLKRRIARAIRLRTRINRAAEAMLSLN